MFDNPVYNVPLHKILESFGCKKGNVRDMFFSPLRSETNASLHVDPSTNRWYDHGAGVGGTNVQLVMMARHLSKDAAIKYIISLDPSLSAQLPQEARKPACEVRRVRELSSNYIARYVEGRKIPWELAQLYCKEIIMHHNVKNENYTLLGFPNNAGGYAMVSPSGYKSTTKAGITTIDTQGKMSVKPSSKSVAVFEGFFDFLSWQVMQSSKLPNCDIVVLNSVNNLQKASAYIAQHDKIVCFLDNDEAGQHCTQAIERQNPDKEVVDMSDLYGNHKDLNEMLQASRGYTENMRLSPTM